MPRRGNWYLGIGLLALTVAAYGPVFRNDFVDFDDEHYITANPRVLEGISPSGIAWACTNRHGNYWMPSSWLSLQLDAQLFSTRGEGGRIVLFPGAFHAVSLAWHAASTLLLFGLLLRLTGMRWRSFLVAALFAVHPLRVESVAWAAERKDVLSMFFGLVTLWAYVWYVARPGWKRYLILTAAFFLSLASKPMLMTLPFVLLLLDYWPLRRLSPSAPWEQERAPASWGRLVLEKLPLLTLAVGIGVLTMVAREKSGAIVPFQSIPLSARLATAVTGYGWYVATTFWPTRLAAMYPHPYEAWSVPAALAGAGMLVTVTALAVWQARRRPWLLVGWLWFVGTLVPVIGLAQGGAQAWADRFSYWPHLGLLVVLVWGLGEVVERLRLPAPVAGAAAAAVLGCLAVLTWRQAGVWKNPRTLWEHALAVTERNHPAHVEIATYYLARGRPDLAAEHYARAVDILPDIPEYRHFLGIALLALGRDAEAADEFRKALSYNGAYPDSWYNLGLARLRQGMPDKAVRSFRKALELEPGSSDSLAGLGLSLWRMGQRADAVRSFREALRHNPGDADAWHGLGLAALAEGRPQEAVQAFNRALQFKPNLIKAYSDLGVALGRLGQWDQAIPWHGRAIELQDRAEMSLHKLHGRVSTPDGLVPFVLFRCRLADALDQVGDRASALETYRAALQRDPQWPRKFAAQAWQLATDPVAGRRDPLRARELARQAVAAVEDPPASFLDAQAAAEAALGRFPEAVRLARRALERASAADTAGVVRSIRSHLHQYQNSRPVVGGDLQGCVRP